MSTSFESLADNIYGSTGANKYDIVKTMAKKTRKEKILADFRRKKSLENSPSQTTHEYEQSSSIYVYPTQFIKKDLTKTILLSILAISLELALYFVFEGKIKIPSNYLPTNFKLW